MGGWTGEAISVGASTIGGIINFEAGHEDGTVRFLADGNPDPHFQGTVSSSAKIRATTSDLKTTFGVHGALGITASGIVARARPFAAGSIRTATGSRIFTVAAGTIVPARLSARQGGAAELSFEVTGYDSSGGDPMAITSGNDALLTPTNDQAWTLGPIVLNGTTRLVDVQSVDIGFGIAVQEFAGDGTPYATSVGIPGRMPSVRVELLDAGIVQTLQGSGTALGDIVIYFRRLIKGTIPDAYANATHCKIAFKAGGAKNARTSGGMTLSNSFDIEPIATGSNALITFTPDSTIVVP